MSINPWTPYVEKARDAFTKRLSENSEAVLFNGYHQTCTGEPTQEFWKVYVWWATGPHYSKWGGVEVEFSYPPTVDGGLFEAADRVLLEAISSDLKEERFRRLVPQHVKKEARQLLSALRRG